MRFGAKLHCLRGRLSNDPSIRFQRLLLEARGPDVKKVYGRDNAAGNAGH